MKYCVLIMDGASGLPLPQRGNKTCLELAETPNLDTLAKEGMIGLTRSVPVGTEPSSACACMSVLGYDPKVYYKGRGGIEARSMGIPISEGEVVFRCNLVAVRDGRMWSYSSGYISNEEARALIADIEEKLGSDSIHFYPGVSYRHICKVKGHEETLQAICTPPHDIPDKSIAEFLPKGPGSGLLRDLMMRSEAILRDHPVNLKRKVRGEIPATMIWLFWGSGQIPDIPSFKEVYGLKAAMTSGVDLLRGLARMMGMDVLDIPGVTDGLDNDYRTQMSKALEALRKYDLIIVHVEAPDEAAHNGSIDDKIEAIQRIDQEMVSQLRAWQRGKLRLLIMPDHATPIKVRTHTDDLVPFLLWGEGFKATGTTRLTETEAKNGGTHIEEGHDIMRKLIREQS